MTNVVIGVCAIVVLVRLLIGNPGRLALIAALVVGASLAFVQNLVGESLDVFGALSSGVAQLGG